MRCTVARLRLQATHADIMFYESPRVFRLPSGHPRYAALVQRLNDAASSGAAVQVRMEAADDGVIADVDG